MSHIFYKNLQTTDGALIQAFYRLSKIHGGSLREKLNKICVPCTFTAVKANKNTLSRFMKFYNSEIQKYEHHGNPAQK